MFWLSFISGRSGKDGKMTLKPSSYFWDMCGVVKDEMLFRDGSPAVAVICWILLPIILATIFGWYIADVSMGKSIR
jgi:hypothetical protein